MNTGSIYDDFGNSNLKKIFSFYYLFLLYNIYIFIY